MKHDDTEIVALFFEVSKWSRSYSTHKKAFNPFSGQYRCLLVLEHTGTIPQKELMEALHIRSTSLSELLAKLEKKELIARIPSEQNKKMLLVSLTEKGKKEAEDYQKSRAKVHENMVTTLSENEKEQFYDILHKIKSYYTSMEESSYAHRNK